MKFPKLFLMIHQNDGVEIVSSIICSGGGTGSGIAIDGKIFPYLSFNNILTYLYSELRVQGQYNPEKFVATIQESV